VPTVETVRGPVDTAELGATLMHEHVFVLSTEHVQNYGTGDWWDEDVRVDDAVAQLNELKALGIDTIVDPTVWGLGRYIPRVQRVAEQTAITSSWPPASTPTTRFPTSTSTAGRGCCSTYPVTP
jgi:phosphotriesterase-related protein